ncbi:MAG: hypothetical protein GXO47_14675 [Chlorobi bacterium]|nr:hypothetical protein [Chlorobiota bacterium]
MKLQTLLLFTLLPLFPDIHAQFEAGIKKEEATTLMRLTRYPYYKAEKRDSIMAIKVPHYKIVHLVDSTALDNAWCVLTNGKQGVISFRGTTEKPISWLENFYAAMIPAVGEVTSPQGKTVQYKFADDPRAGVQSGWSLALLVMSKEILSEMRKLNEKGIYDFYITGHSQGGALALLFRALLEHLPDSVLDPKNNFKTYAFAAPKPGNRFFTYDYNRICNTNLSSFNFINAYDWVPQVPFSVQSPNNITEPNPFVEFENSKEGSWIKRIALHQLYHSMTKPIEKAQKKLNKNLGHRVKKIVEKTTGGFTVPEYMADAAYFPAGISIIIDRYEPLLNPDNEKDVFWQHKPEHYIELVDKFFDQQ